MSGGRPKVGLGAMASILGVSSSLLIISLLGAHTQQVDAAKVDCYPIDGVTREKCEALGCVWSPVARINKLPANQTDFEPAPSTLGIVGPDREPKSRVGEPWCHFPDDYMGYKIVESTGYMIKLARARPSALGNDVQQLIISMKFYEKGNVLGLVIEDSDQARFKPEIPVLSAVALDETSMEEAQSSARAFKIELEPRQQVSTTTTSSRVQVDNRYILTIKRASTGAPVFSTDLGKLIFTDKFIQLNSELSSPFVFGLGEHYDTFLKWAGEYKTYSFWNTDHIAESGGTRSYGGFPFFVNLDSPGHSMAHGVYLRNSNAMDIVLQNDVSVTFRPIGGILEFYLFGGPTPHDVIEQYQKLVGLPDLPARWALGFQLCRFNYHTLEKTRLVWKRTRDSGIPFDVQWNDIDVMERYNDFTYDPVRFAGLPEFVDELHAAGMYYITLTDPGISQEPNNYPYELGTQMDIWIKNSTNQPLVGKVWNQSGRTVFPDFSNPKSHEYWIKMFVDFQKVVKYDGAWIDMNDISNFVDGSLDGCPEDNYLEQTPYSPGGYKLQQKTLCLSAKHQASHEYNIHNIYSFYETIATEKAMRAARPGRRSVIISRSSHPGQGHYGGHWNGDVPSTWEYLRWSIPSYIEHSMYGYSMMGADICGFSGNTTPELCARWSTLGAFYTFSRNHNDDTSIDQDPVALGPEVVAANKNAFTKRYSLLPYLYTLVYNAHKHGQPVPRSVAFEFFQQHELEAFKAENQFMFGPAIMIAPVVDENTYTKRTYLPEGRWYETDILPESMSFVARQVKVPTKIDVAKGVKHWHQTNHIGLTNMPIFYRGGHIVPVYARVGQTIADTERNQSISLEVALCEHGRAKGELHMDDGDSIRDVTNYLKMTADDTMGTLRIDLVKDHYKKQVQFGHVKVMGVEGKITKVELVSQEGDHHRELPYEQISHMLIFDLGSQPVTMAEPITVKWTTR
uniref:Lysosomal alpha-glucosidase n=1 Tax=Aceria tosichella TaxID=561515 RepID=A0A6G1SJT3_9ACAR